MCGNIKRLANKVALLNPRDPYRKQMEERILNKLYDMALISSKSAFSAVDRLTVSAFCR
jgi:U3 small nucleolar ribonucleoprotein protein IMP3